ARLPEVTCSAAALGSSRHYFRKVTAKPKRPSLFGWGACCCAHRLAGFVAVPSPAASAWPCDALDSQLMAVACRRVSLPPTGGITAGHRLAGVSVPPRRDGPTPAPPSAPRVGLARRSNRPKMPHNELTER